MKFGFAGVAATFATAFAGVVSAQDYSTDQYGVHVLTSGHGCFITADWTPAGRSQINMEIAQMIDGELLVAISSEGWSRPAPGTEKGMFFEFWGPDGKQHIVGMTGRPLGTDGTYTERKGLMAAVLPEFRDEFVSAFGSSRVFRLLTQDVDTPATDHFDTVLEAPLPGSARAVSRLQTCVSDVRASVEADRRRDERMAHIDRDPFSDDE